VIDTAATDARDSIADIVRKEVAVAPATSRLVTHLSTVKADSIVLHDLALAAVVPILFLEKAFA
jgi:hypothetical protein